MKKLLTALLLLLCGTVLQAQTPVSEIVEIPLLSNYDLDSTSYVYCLTTGRGGDPGGGWLPGNGKIKTSGSSATVTSNTASTSALTSLAVGDELLITYQGLLIRAYVSAAASADSITVGTAIDISSGATYSFRRRSCGTSGGYFPTRQLSVWKLVVIVDQLDVTGGIDVKVECYVNSAVPTPEVVSESSPGTKGVKNITAVGTYTILASFYPSDACRLGLKIGSADDGADTTTHTEKISAYVSAWR